jgi:hypothetical protein
MLLLVLVLVLIILLLKRFVVVVVVVVRLGLPRLLIHSWLLLLLLLLLLNRHRLLVGEILLLRQLLCRRLCRVGWRRSMWVSIRWLWIRLCINWRMLYTWCILLLWGACRRNRCWLLVGLCVGCVLVGRRYLKELLLLILWLNWRRLCCPSLRYGVILVCWLLGGIKRRAICNW